MGLRKLHWTDTTMEAITWYEEQEAKAVTDLPLGIHLTMGERADEKRANVARNYREGRLRQVMGAFSKE